MFLSDTGISDAVVAHISDHSRLVSLDLNKTGIGDATMRYLAKLPKLASLDLRATRVTDEGLRALGRSESLRTLQLHGCAISDEGLAHLGQMKALRVVNLGRMKSVTSAGVARLTKLKPDLHVSWDWTVEKPSAERPDLSAAGEHSE